MNNYETRARKYEQALFGIVIRVHEECDYSRLVLSQSLPRWFGDGVHTHYIQNLKHDSDNHEGRQNWKRPTTPHQIRSSAVVQHEQCTTIFAKNKAREYVRLTVVQKCTLDIDGLNDPSRRVSGDGQWNETHSAI